MMLYNNTMMMPTLPKRISYQMLEPKVQMNAITISHYNIAMDLDTISLSFDSHYLRKVTD